MQVSRMIRALMPRVLIVYGGVHPTYFWRDILAAAPQIDIIVRGEGEETAVKLFDALRSQQSYAQIAGLAFREDGAIKGTPAAPVIKDLDAYRVGWELIDHKRYSYWGGKRAVVIQFSRGCPHLCNYCGQRGFWTRWRHRDPKKLAAEMARLHREHGVEVFNFADENPSAGRKPWKKFLEALIAENVDVTLIGSTRADDIVRDADILHLYKKAGFERFLMGMENTDEATQTRPRALRRLIWHPEKKIRHAIRWYYRMGRRVWFHEMISFFLRETRVTDGMTVRAFLGAAQDAEEEAMAVKKRAAA
jgi:anaerobic magnesium-protoporphyrin IX monomethyl ester cyclase